MKLYFDDFSFKHPTPVNFIRCAEKVSGLELDWYLNDWTQTTNTIETATSDYLDYSGTPFENSGGARKIKINNPKETLEG